MLTYALLADGAILIVEPKGFLESTDFEAVARAADPYIEERGTLRGLLI